MSKWITRTAWTVVSVAILLAAVTYLSLCPNGLGLYGWWVTVC